MAGQKQENEGSTTTHITGTLVETNISSPSVVFVSVSPLEGPRKLILNFKDREGRTKACSLFIE